MNWIMWQRKVLETFPVRYLKLSMFGISIQTINNQIVTNLQIASKLWEPVSTGYSIKCIPQLQTINQQFIIVTIKNQFKNCVVSTIQDSECVLYSFARLPLWTCDWESCRNDTHPFYRILFLYLEWNVSWNQTTCTCTYVPYKNHF